MDYYKGDNMENSEFYLHGTDPAHDGKMRLAYGVIGLSYICFGISMIFHYQSAYMNVLLVGGIGAFVYALGYKRFVKRYYIILDENGLSAILYTFTKRPKKSSLSIDWHEVAAITIRPLKLMLELRNGTTHEIELGDLLYKQHQQLKSSLIAIAREREIAVEVL